MKSVLISIQPKWCELIASGKKTVEVRKTKPKLDTPFKCYIYCTKGFKSNTRYSYKTWAGYGKVIGEFVCDNIITDKTFGHDALFNSMSCMSDAEIAAYCVNREMYGWHISNLVIYDKPKELRVFRVVDNEAVKECQYRERIYNNPDLTNGAFLLGSYLCRDKTNWCTKCKTKPLTRPPQSWCYVEVLR